MSSMLRSADEFLALLAAAAVPLLSYGVAHFEAAERPWMWLLVIAGAVFSLPTAAQEIARRIRSGPASVAGAALLHGAMLGPVPTAISAVALVVVCGLCAGAALAGLQRRRSGR